MKSLPIIWIALGVGLLFNAASGRPVRVDLMITPPILDHNEISRLMQVEGREPLDVEHLPFVCRSILAELRKRGYPLAEIDSVIFGEDYDHMNATIYVSGRDQLKCEDDNGEKIPIDADRLEARIESKLDSLVGAGFPFASVTILPDSPIDSRQISEIVVKTKIAPGAFLRIGRIEFPGGEDISERYLRLESRLKQGDPFQRISLQKAVARLRRLSVVEWIDDPYMREVSSGILEIQIPIRTKSSTRVSGIAAISPGASEPAGQFTFDIGNLFGGGRSASFAWYGLNPDQRGLKGGYTERWLAGLPLSITGELEGWLTKRSHNRTTYRLGGAWEPLSDLLMGISWASEGVVGLNDQSQALNSSTDWYETRVEITRLDSDWNPSTGYRLLGIGSRGYRKYSLTGIRNTLESGRSVFEFARPIDFGSVSKKRIRGGWNSLPLLPTKWIGYAKLENRFIVGNDLLEDELPRFGGHASLRGYPEDSFSGRNVVFGSLELRYRSDLQSGYIGVTGDGGWITESSFGSPTGKRTGTSFGLTAAFQTVVGRMVVDLAWPTGESIEQSRLHVTMSGWL